MLENLKSCVNARFMREGLATSAVSFEMFVLFPTNLTCRICVCVCVRSSLGVSGSSYTPVFLNGWKPPGAELEGWIDPIQVEHNKDGEQEKLAVIIIKTIISCSFTSHF